MNNYIYTERVDLFEPNVYIQYLVQVTGNPDPDALVSAVKTAFISNESTMSRIVLNKDGSAFYQKVSESGCKVNITKNTWKDIIIQNEKIPFAIDKGELMRVFVITSGDSVNLLIIAHHLVGDGKAVTYFIEDIMKALSGESLEYKPIKLITKDSMPPKSELPLLIRLYVKTLNKKWKPTGRTFNWDDYYNIHKAYWDEHSSRIIYEFFPMEEVNRLHAHAKDIGVSINSYITTAFLEADRDNSTIGMPVNIRPNHNKSVSNQATGISVDHKFSDKISFDENAKRIHRKIQYKLKKPIMKYFILRYLLLFNPSLLDSVLLFTYGLYQNKTTQKIARIMGYAGGKTRELGITNLTKLDIPSTYGNYGLKTGLFIPPVVSYAKHIIGVSTMEDGMMISYHFMSNQDREKEAKFFNRAIENIKTVV